MDRIIRILIADDNKELVNVLATYIQKQEDMEIVGVAKDGKEAIEMIERKKPDIVLLDVIMPLIDGLGVLEKVKIMKKEDRPLCIMISAIGNDLVIQRAMTLGAEYFIKKPFDLERVVTIIRNFTFSESTPKNLLTNVENNFKEQYRQDFIDTESEEENLEVLVTRYIHKMGIPAHLKGHSYLREALIMRINDINVTDKITKILYPKVANKFETKPSCVERAIRNAIEVAWTRKKQEMIDIEEIFGNTILKSKGKPSNSEFIATIAEEIRMQYGIK